MQNNTIKIVMKYKTGKILKLRNWIPTLFKLYTKKTYKFSTTVEENEKLLYLRYKVQVYKRNNYNYNFLIYFIA